MIKLSQDLIKCKVKVIIKNALKGQIMCFFQDLKEFVRFLKFAESVIKLLVKVCIYSISRLFILHLLN